MMYQILKDVFHTSTFAIFQLWLRDLAPILFEFHELDLPCKNRLLYQEQVYTNTTNICNIINRTGRTEEEREMGFS